MGKEGELVWDVLRAENDRVRSEFVYSASLLSNLAQLENSFGPVSVLPQGEPDIAGWKTRAIGGTFY
jgi:hypothetical protein